MELKYYLLNVGDATGSQYNISAETLSSVRKNLVETQLILKSNDSIPTDPSCPFYGKTPLTCDEAIAIVTSSAWQIEI